MSKTLLLVDYENVGKIDLTGIPDDVTVLFFFGASQKTVPMEFLKAALKLGERLVPIDIEGHGKNALDFHIAFYLGEKLALNPQTPCVILSKDKGFDPLIKHMVGRSLQVRRAATLHEAFAKSTPAETPSRPTTATPTALLNDALKWLQGMAKNKRPRKRKGLVAHLHSHCGKKIPASEIEALVDRWIIEKQLTENNSAITYHF